MNKKAIHHMTWKEVEEKFKEDPVVLIPLGSMEEHGPHSITGDYLASTEVAERIANQTGALYVPTVPFGNSEYFRGYPGTISLSQDTATLLLEDICISLIEHDIKRIVFVNGHAGNRSAIDVVARKMKREYNITITAMNLWQMLNPSQKDDIYQEEDPSGHGGEPLTSVMSYLHPEKMRMDLLPEKWEVKEKYQSLFLAGLGEIDLDGSQANVFINMEDISEEGILGNPTNASAERGEKIINAVVDYGVKLVEQVKK